MKTALIPGVPAVLLVIALVLIMIVIPPAVRADNTTVTTTQSAGQTTTATTVPTSNQTTSDTNVTTTTLTTTSPTSTQTIIASSAQVAAVAWFSAEPLYGSAPLGVQFTDTSTGVTPTSWEWFFGDGTTAYVQNPYHIYTEPGTYSVSMNTVIGGFSYTAIRNDLIEVRTPETTATATATTTATTTTTSVTTTSATGSGVEAAFFGAPRRGSAPLTVTFMDASTGSPGSWQWDFGDGETSTLANPSHTYTQAGAYTVTLTVTGGGASDEMKLPNYVTVSAPTSPVTTQTTAPVSVTGTTRAPGTGASLSTESTTAAPSGGGIDLGGLSGIIIAIVVIAVIAGTAFMIYRRRNRYDLLK